MMQCYRCTAWPCTCSDGQTILHGDCRELLPTLGMFDVCLTDPPYGAQKAEWDARFDENIYHIIEGKAFVYGIMPGISNVPTLPKAIGDAKYLWLMAAHLVNGRSRGAIGFGNWIACAIYAYETVKLYDQSTDCLDIKLGRYDKPAHASPKPLEVMLWLVSRLGYGSIIDPYMGSGTTLVAAKALGRRATGIERDERYCAIAANRLRQEVLPLAVLTPQALVSAILPLFGEE